MYHVPKRVTTYHLFRATSERLSIIARGAIPYGNEWYGYFMRRLAERPANLAFFLRALATRD